LFAVGFLQALDLVSVEQQAVLLNVPVEFEGAGIFSLA